MWKGNQREDRGVRIVRGMFKINHLIASYSLSFVSFSSFHHSLFVSLQSFVLQRFKSSHASKPNSEDLAHLVAKLHIHKLDDWYDVPKLQIRLFDGKSNLLKKYPHKTSHALPVVYLLFLFLLDVCIDTSFLTSLFTFIMPLPFSSPFFSCLFLISARHRTVEDIVCTYFPHHPWEHDKFANQSFTPQHFMRRIITSLFPGIHLHFPPSLPPSFPPSLPPSPPVCLLMNPTHAS